MHRMNRRVVKFLAAVFALALLSICASLTAQQSYPPPYPRKNAKLVLQNERVNAWEVYWPKGEPTPMHEHTIDQLSITLNGGSVRVTTREGKVNEGHSHLGMVVFTPHGTVHQEEGTSDMPQHKIMLEIKPSPASSSPDADAGRGFPPEGAVKALENDRLIAWDYTWNPRENVSMSENFDSVTVFLVGGTIRTSRAGAPVTEIERKPGDVLYQPRDEGTQVEEVVNGSPRAIIVQLK